MSMPIPTGPPPVVPTLPNVVSGLKADIAAKSQKGTLVQYGPRWYPRPQTDSWWTTTGTASLNTLYQVAHVVIPDPGYPYYIGVQAALQVSGASSGSEYQHAAWVAVDWNFANTLAAGQDPIVVGYDWAKAVAAGNIVFRINGHSQQQWTGSHTVYFFVHCGGGSTFVLGQYNGSNIYTFDVETIPVPTM